MESSLLLKCLCVIVLNLCICYYIFSCAIDAVDGLLAAVTDLLTHVLTIGKAIVDFGLEPNIRPTVIHIYSGFNKIDLVNNYQSSSNLPARFHELLNMFPNNKVSAIKIWKIRALVGILTQ